MELHLSPYRRHAGPGAGIIRVEFIAGGDLHEGFALIYCDACRHEYLLACSPARASAGLGAVLGHPHHLSPGH